MVTRRYLRTKVMQAIYAFDNNNQEEIVSADKKLTTSVQNFYTLFLYLFALIPEIRRYRLNKLESLKEKINPTAEDLNPNTKFVDNIVCLQIEDSPSLNILWNEQKINWSDNKDIIISIFQEISKSDFFIDYMNNPEKSYLEDKSLVLNIVEKIFANSELIHWFLEEKNVHWFDDYNEALLMLYLNIKSFKEAQGINVKIEPLLKNKKEDTDFYRSLFMKTVTNDALYNDMIIENLQNWEIERLMLTDIILIKMAICELMEFPSIPIKVTINEYIELAKLFSSNKSGTFINGMLDKMVTKLKSEGKLNKTGRGLLN